jgi:hypothetical protein
MTKKLYTGNKGEGRKNILKQTCQTLKVPVLYRNKYLAI